MSGQQQALRWKLTPYGAQWAVTEEGTGYVILMKNARIDAEKAGKELASKAGVELIIPSDEEPLDDPIRGLD
jgi:hypothetical protein